MKQPIKFEIDILVKKKHLDELNHVNNVVYLEFLQEAAMAHWHHAADVKFIESIRWVVRKHVIEYLKPAQLQDQLRITTWVENFTSVSSLRKYEITLNDELILKAETLWIALNITTMKPKRVDKSINNYFFHSH